MKKTLLFIALVLGTSSLTFAQADNAVATKHATNAAAMTPDQRIDQRVQGLTKNLNLTTQQQTSIKQIMIDTHTAMQAAKNQKDKAKVEQLKNQMHEQITAQLNPDQKMKFNKFVAEKKEKSQQTQKAH